MGAGFELLDSVGQARGDLAHPVGVDADPDVLHRREHARERKLDLPVQRVEAALGDARAELRLELERRGRLADESGGLLVGRRLGDELDAVLRRQVVEKVRRAAGLDQVGHEQRIVGGVDPRGLGVMDDQRRIAQPPGVLGRPGADDHRLSFAREREAPVVDLDRGRPRPRGQLALDPGHLDAGHLDRRRRERLVELVHAGKQVPELEAAEDLLQLGAVGRREDELRRVDVERQVAPHRRQHLRAARLLGMLANVLCTRGRELVDVLEHPFERAVLRDELAGGLVPDPGDAGDVVGGVPLEADEVRHLLRGDPVAGEDPLRRVDVDVGHAARRHHQADVLGAELERVAVGRDHAGLHACLVGARRERGDNVVRLPALELEVPVAEGLDDRPEVGELLAQEVGHRPPVDLVLGVELLPVDGARVPRDRDPARPIVGEELEEHVGEPEQGVRGEALGRRQLLGQREVGAVGEVVPVDEEELGRAGGRVVELELGACQRLRHLPASLVPGAAVPAFTLSARCAHHACGFRR